jgi:hypothetical protein
MEYEYAHVIYINIIYTEDAYETKVSANLFAIKKAKSIGFRVDIGIKRYS